MKVIFISQFAVYRLQMFNFLLVGRWAGSEDLGTPEIFRTLKICNNNFCGQLVIHQLAGVFCMHIVRTYVQGEQAVYSGYIILCAYISLSDVKTL